MTNAALSAALTEHFIAHRSTLIGRLQQAYPGFCIGQIEDAAGQAILIALESLSKPKSCFVSAWSKDGERGLERMFYTVAWRQLRGIYRRKSTQMECYPEQVPEVHDAYSPLSSLEARQTSARLEGLLREASQRFSKRSSQALQLALRDRLMESSSDGAAAARYSVDRTLVCRARNWVRAQVEH